MELETPYVDVPSLNSPLFFCSLLFLLLCGAVPFLPLPYVRAERELGRASVSRELEQCHCGVLCTFLCERACRAGRESERGKSDGRRAQEGKVLKWRTLAGGLGLPPGFGYVFTCCERTRRAAAAGTSIHFTGLSTLALHFLFYLHSLFFFSP